jgi:hypothetical protein
MLELLLVDSRPAGDTSEDQKLPSGHNSRSGTVPPEYGSDRRTKREKKNKKIKITATIPELIKQAFTMGKLSLHTDNPG